MPTEAVKFLSKVCFVANPLAYQSLYGREEFTTSLLPEVLFAPIIIDKYIAFRAASGYFWTLWVPEARLFYATREALWRDHLFETFLEWVNDKLLRARWIGIYGSREIEVTWVKVLTDRPEHEREQHGKGIVVPL